MKKSIIFITCILIIGMMVFLLRRDRDIECYETPKQSTPKKVLAEKESEYDFWEDTEFWLEENSDDAYIDINKTTMDIVNPESDYQTRLTSLRSLSRRINNNDLQALMKFLRSNDSEQNAITNLELMSVKNDLVEVLLQQEELPSYMGFLLADIFTNPNQDEVWRNYTLQFMPSVYKRIESTDENAYASKEKELQLVQAALWQAIDETDNSNAGTALLGLDELSDNYESFSNDDVKKAVIDVALDNSAVEANRITALRICGESGYSDALETVRELAENGENTTLRCVAIVTLGELGNSNDFSLLDEYAISDNARISQAALSALDKIKQTN